MKKYNISFDETLDASDAFNMIEQAMMNNIGDGEEMRFGNGYVVKRSSLWCRPGELFYTVTKD